MSTISNQADEIFELKEKVNRLTKTIKHQCQIEKFWKDEFVKSVESLEVVTTVFRKLRESWFNAKLRSYGHERDWDDQDEERQELRNQQNRSSKAKYDEQTEAIIHGEKRCLAPTCDNDMTIKRV